MIGRPKLAAARIIYELAQCKGMSITELSESLNIPRHVVRNNLKEMTKEKLVYKNHVWHFNRKVVS